MLLTVAYNMLPLILFMMSWVWWGLLFGVPVWLLSKEVVMFEQRAIYRPLQHVPFLRSSVRGVEPYAAAFLRASDPVAAAVIGVGSLFLQWARSMASM